MKARQAKKQATKNAVAEPTKSTVSTPVVEAEVNNIVETKIEEAVEVAVEEAVEVKTPAKKAPAKKTTEKKTAEKKSSEKKELAPEIFIQYGNKEAELEQVVAAAKQAYVDLGHRVSSIKDLKVYLKPEDFAAYYVINGKVAGKVDLF